MTRLHIQLQEYFPVQFDQGSLNDQKVICTAFSQTFLKKFAGDRKENKNKELVNYSIDRLVLRRDGSSCDRRIYYETSERIGTYTQTVNSHLLPFW